MRRCTRGRCWVRSRVFRGELFCLASLCCWVCVCLGLYRAAYSFSMLFRFLFVWGSIGLRIAFWVLLHQCIRRFVRSRIHSGLS
jgi:hypothetical protein